MQIKTNQSTKNTSNTDLVRRWLDMTLPAIAGLIILPCLFLFLGSLYTEEFHSIPAQTLIGIFVVQGFLIIITPIITAWVTLKHVSKQLQALAQAISASADQLSERTFCNDNWFSLEKQYDEIGQTARKIKNAIQGKNAHHPLDDAEEESLRNSRRVSDSNYSSLFSLNVTESNTQIQ
jgi:hypothetical protein